MIRDVLEQPKILVIEDNLIASKTAQMVLEAHGCLVDCVGWAVGRSVWFAFANASQGQLGTRNQ